MGFHPPLVSKVSPPVLRARPLLWSGGPSSRCTGWLGVSASPSNGSRVKRLFNPLPSSAPGVILTHSSGRRPMNPRFPASKMFMLAPKPYRKVDRIDNRAAAQAAQMMMTVVTQTTGEAAGTAAGDGLTAAADPMVAFEDVSKRFAAGRTSAEVAALDGVDLIVPRGSVTGIIGRSGAGKSTLIRLVNGLEKPTSGRVVVDGVNIAGLDEKRLRDVRRSIGMIFQHFNLLSSRTAFDNIALPLEIAGVDRQAIEKRVTPLLDLVGLSDKRLHLPEFLTRQMVEKPEPGLRTILRIIFKGENATEPMLARLGSDLGIEVNIMAGAVDEIAGRPFGMQR
eukprot:gene7368-9051_t